MRLRSLILTLAAVLLAPALAAARSSSALEAMPSDAQCRPLPRITTPHLPAGETLDYDIDVLTANAARMHVETLPETDGVVPIRVQFQTNTFFNKVRKVKAEAKSYLNATSLRPTRYTEDSWEDALHKVAEVSFAPHGKKQKVVRIRFASNPKPGAPRSQIFGRYAHDALDDVGAIYYLRSLDLKPGLSVCFDVYAMRHMFRVWGTVGPIEHVTTPAGEFKAFHLVGTAARIDNPKFQRALHVWISDDARRLPVGAMGGIDLGPVRATLTHVGKPGGKAPESHAKGLAW